MIKTTLLMTIVLGSALWLYVTLIPVSVGSIIVFGMVIALTFNPLKDLCHRLRVRTNR